MGEQGVCCRSFTQTPGYVRQGLILSGEDIFFPDEAEESSGAHHVEYLLLQPGKD